MNNWIIRLIAILLHAAVSIILVSYIVDFDITGKWITFFGFIVLLLILLFLFVKHVISFYYFIKTKIK